LYWKGPFKSLSYNPPAMGRDTFHWTRLLKAPSNLALNTSRDRGHIFWVILSIDVNQLVLIDF